MRRFILLIFLCCLTLGISAQTAKEEIFENIQQQTIKPIPILTLRKLRRRQDINRSI